MARSAALLPYSPSPLPVMDGGGEAYFQGELSRVGATLNALLEMTPQAATEAPARPRDGMIRLSRAPWRPLGAAQTADQWVWFDATAAAWKAF